MPQPQKFVEAMLNLSRYHREHEKFYARAPLKQAIAMQDTSRLLKNFADRWEETEPREPEPGNPYLGCEDLNDPSEIQASGVLFMEGQEEPPEVARLKRDLATMSDDFQETGKWLTEAMETSWKIAGSLVEYPALADVLGERHRIIANDWQAAGLSSMVSRLLRRALDILETIDFTPAFIRSDMSGARIIPARLRSASELIDRAADLAAESATLVHDNDRRWRIFRERAAAVSPEPPETKE